MRDALRALGEHHTRRGKGKPAGAWSVGGRRKEIIRGFTTKLAVLLVLGGLFCYLVLPGLIENQLAGRLQAAFGATTSPDVEVSSNFPLELLLGRIDRIQVKGLQSSVFYSARADLRDVSVSVPSLPEGDPRIEARNCSLSIEAPAVFIDQDQACLGYLGLTGG